MLGPNVAITRRPARVVFSVHGIRTAGRWQKDIAPLLSEAGFTPVALDYRYFHAFQLLLKHSRQKKVDWFRDIYTSECDQYECNLPSIIGHSFGTYLLATAMLKYRQIKFDRIILCGSIVRREFPWQELADRGQVGAVLNQSSAADLWARAVEWVVPDGGQSGLLGFKGTSQVLTEDPNPKFAHSSYFYHLNYRKTWIPFLRGETVSPRAGFKPARMNWRFLLTSTVLCIIFAFVIYVAIALYRNGSNPLSPPTTVQPTENRPVTNPSVIISNSDDKARSHGIKANTHGEATGRRTQSTLPLPKQFRARDQWEAQVSSPQTISSADFGSADLGSSVQEFTYRGVKFTGSASDELSPKLSVIAVSGHQVLASGATKITLALPEGIDSVGANLVCTQGEVLNREISFTATLSTGQSARVNGTVGTPVFIGFISPETVPWIKFQCSERYLAIESFFFGNRKQ